MNNENIFSRFWHNINKILVPRNAKVEETSSNFVVTLQNAKGETKEEREDLVTFNIPKKISPLISDNVHVLDETSDHRNDIDSTGMHIINANDKSKVAQFTANGASIAVDGSEVFHIDPSAEAGHRGLYMPFGDYERIDQADTLVATIRTLPKPDTTVNVIFFTAYSTGGSEQYGSQHVYSLTYNGATESTASYTQTNRYTLTVRLTPSGEVYVRASELYSNVQGVRMPVSGSGCAIRWTVPTYAPQFTFGTNSDASAKNTAAIGEGTLASGDAQTALGRGNIEDTSNDYALIIGNGVSTLRSNALTVDWNGNVSCGTVNGVDISDTGWTVVDSSYPGYQYRVKNGICYISLENVNFTTTGTHTLPALPESARPSINVQPFIRGGTTLCGAGVTTAGVLNIGVTTTGYHAGFGCGPVG